LIEGVMNEKLIQLNVEVADWQEAIQKAMQPFIRYGYVKQSYVDAIIQNVNDLGPYIVITKHVALPHAQTESGTLKNGIGIATLKKPIYFGNEDNDPVKYLFGLSATDSENHLDALADLAQLIEDPSFFSLLDTAESSQEVMKYLQERF